jgi:hypothetical protein
LRRFSFAWIGSWSRHGFSVPVRRPRELLRWAAVLDLIGYYLAPAVVAYVLWRELRPRHPLIADLSTMAACGYALAGGVGAAVLAMVAPMLMHDDTAASSANQALIAAQFALLLDVVWRSVWQLLDRLLIAGWALGLGLLVRVDRPGLYRLLLLAAVATVGTVANVAGFDWARDVMTGVVGTLWAVWWVWLLVLFVRSSQPTSCSSV